MALKVPRHSISATPIYIAQTDPAWDRDRIKRENDEVEAALSAWRESQTEGHDPPPRPPGHEERPINIYFSGESRYDLDARHPWRGEHVAARDYLTGDPTRFVLRRMSMTSFARVTDWIQRRTKAEAESGRVDASEWNQIMLYCAQHGIADVQNLEGFDLERSGELVSEASIQVLHDVGGMALIEELGLAVFRLSQPLSKAEKKASG